MMRAAALFFFLLLAFAAVNAQSPTPIIVVPASGTAPTTSSATAGSTASRPAASTADSESILAAIKQLEKIKAANDEVLAKQKAALEKLDEIQDAADQLRIFAKRG